MKSSFAILYFFNILNACMINFVDGTKEKYTRYGYMQLHSEVSESKQFDQGKPTNVFFLKKDYECIGYAIACWKHCNRVDRHVTYDAIVEKKEGFGESEYQICVFSTPGKHEFDMCVFKDKESKSYRICIFKDVLCSCIFINSILKDNARCCSFPGDSLVKILQEYEYSQKLNV